jgi:hypothetical protein
MKIFLDDLDMPEANHAQWEIARTPEKFKALVLEAMDSGEPVEAIQFDNDLGITDESVVCKEGRDCLEWLSQVYPEVIVGDENGAGKAELILRTDNSVAGRAMQEYYQFCLSHAKEIRENKVSREELDEKGDVKQESAFGEIERKSTRR